MNASSQPAYLRLPFRLAFTVASARARLSAILRRSPKFLAALRSRTRLASSRKPKAGAQCSPFPPPPGEPAVGAPVPPVLPPPVVPDGGRHRLRRECRARQVVADLGRDLAPA